MEQLSRNNNKLRTVTQKGDSGYRAIIFAQIGRNGNGDCNRQIATEADILSLFK